MSFRNYLQQLRESLKSRTSPRKRTCQLTLEKMEERLAPVVGALALPPLVAPGTGWDGVVDVNCTGALLAGRPNEPQPQQFFDGRHILTAAHCFTDNMGRINRPSQVVTFNLPGRNISMTVPQADYFIHPSWNGRVENGNDIAILRLPALAPSGPRGIGADRYEINRNTNEVGRDFTFVGYGATNIRCNAPLAPACGGVADGRTLDARSGHDGSFGRKAIGQNRYDTLSGNAGGPNTALAYDFDDGTAANDTLCVRFQICNRGRGAVEAGQAPGDSGGPTFIDGRIATVNSFSTLTSRGFGNIAHNTRVSTFAGWIDQVTRGRHDLVLDMEKQPAGQDANPDTILLRRTGAFLDIFVNDVFYHRVLHAAVGRFIFRGSAAADQLRVPADLDLPFTGTVDGRGGADQLVVLSRANSRTYTVTDTHVDFGGRVGDPSFQYRDLADLQLGAGATDTVNIWSTAAGTPVFVSEAGTVNIGPLGNLAVIRSAVSVRNPAGFTALTINNSADTVVRSNVMLSATSLTGLAATGAINWVQNDLASLTIRGGNRSNTYNILGTPRRTPGGGLTTQLIGGSAIDTFNVMATGGPLAIEGVAGADRVNLGNPTNGVQSVQGTVTLQNAGGQTVLNVNDTGNNAGRTATQSLPGTGFAVISGLAPGVVTINYRLSQTGAVNITLGGGADTFTVENTDTAGLDPTTLNTGLGDDTVHVRGTTGSLTVNTGGGTNSVNVGNTANRLDGIAGVLTVNGQGGSNTLTLNDQGSSSAKTYVIDPFTVLRFGTPGTAINYRTVTNLVLNGGSGGNVVSVSGTAASALVTLNAGAGTDAISVGQLAEIGGRLTVNGQGGTDTLTGPDAPLAWRLTGSDAGNLGSAVTFAQVENLVGGGADDVFVFANGAGTSGFVDGGGGVNTLDYSAWTSGVYVDLANFIAAGTGFIVNFKNAFGGAGDDYLHGDWQDNWLVGNDGHDILVGGDSADYLQGGAGRDQLYGGNGADWLEGGGGEDLLIDGITNYDDDVVALSEIWTEWVLGGGNFDTRVENLRNGTGLSTYRLDVNNVFSDGEGDVLLGEGDRDWFWTLDGMDFIDFEDGDVLN